MSCVVQSTKIQDLLVLTAQQDFKALGGKGRAHYLLPEGMGGPIHKIDAIVVEVCGISVRSGNEHIETNMDAQVLDLWYPEET